MSEEAPSLDFQVAMALLQNTIHLDSSRRLIWEPAGHLEITLKLLYERGPHRAGIRTTMPADLDVRTTLDVIRRMVYEVDAALDQVGTINTLRLDFHLTHESAK